MTRGKLIAGVLVMVALAVLVVSGVALAASVSPITHSGNTPRGCDLKIEDPATGVYAIPGYSGKTISITVSSYQGGEQLAFSSDLPVLKAYMKGGDGYNEYDYGAQGTNADSGLVCPLNNGGNVPAISHVSFCFGQVVTTSSTTTTITVSPTSSSTTSSSTTTTSGGVVAGESTTTTTTSEVGSDEDPGDDNRGDEGPGAGEDPGDSGQGDDDQSDDGGSTGSTDDTTTSDTVVGGETQDTSSTSEVDLGGAEQDVTTVTEIQTGAADFGGPGAGVWALGLLALGLAGGVGWSALRPAFRKK